MGKLFRQLTVRKVVGQRSGAIMDLLHLTVQMALKRIEILIFVEAFLPIPKRNHNLHSKQLHIFLFFIFR